MATEIVADHPSDGVQSSIRIEAPQTDVTAAATGTAEERLELAKEAAYEIESIARVLLRLDDTDEKAFVMRGLCLRLEALSGIVISVSGSGDPNREVAEMRAVLFGNQCRQHSEVAYV